MKTGMLEPVTKIKPGDLVWQLDGVWHQVIATRLTGSTWHPTVTLRFANDTEQHFHSGYRVPMARRGTLTQLVAAQALSRIGPA